MGYSGLMTHIPTTILSGYLGAGKTTLVNHLLAGDHGRRIAVLVNDFGAVNIDAALIENADDQTISLTNGCVCCSITDDLGAALQAQTERSDPPEQIIIEASGVAEPARMALYADGWPGVALDAVVTLVDAETIRARAGDRFVGSVVKRQIAAADILLLNKADLTDDVIGLKAWLGTLNGDVDAIDCVQGRVATEVLLGSGRGLAPASFCDLPHLHFATEVWMPLGPVDTNDLRSSFETFPDTVHRVKGFLTDADTGRPVLVQRVGRRLTLTALETAPGSPDQLVLIGTGAGDLRDAITGLGGLQEQMSTEPN